LTNSPHPPPLQALDLVPSCVALVAATGVYTIFGGLVAVIYTEVLQALVLIGGCIALMAVCLLHVGGLQALFSTLPPRMTHLFASEASTSFPWYGVMFGMPFTSIWYWCTDQVIVQRALAAKDIHHGRSGAIIAGFLKILPVFMIVVPGMTAFVLFRDDVVRDHNAAFPKLVVALLPSPLRGLMVASMLAALMSSLASVFNSGSTIFTMDVYRKVTPPPSLKHHPDFMPT
jgi:solute:Na+ symporter, SSS family